ncbi:transmembrane protein, putative [Medicago truncatula]|uniref:Transmembrane protein, putative n=1 Tax=Medicago truncatula TaxID=3880 RepID=G7KH41_MEDTR|nr:transmembrane protein, putative [Medicago truncatula]
MVMDMKNKRKIFKDFAKIHFQFFEDVFCDFVGTSSIDGGERKNFNREGMGGNMANHVTSIFFIVTTIHLLE